MPRNLSGTATRLTPPGPTGYVTGADILPSEIHGEMNDIYNEITNSIDKGGRTTPTNDLPMGGFVHSGLGIANASGETLRYDALTKATSVNITASGTQPIPIEGSLIEFTSAGAFNLTGFNNVYDGRRIAVKFPANLTLIDSNSFKLRNRISRVLVAGEMTEFIQDGAGIWQEMGDLPTINLTNYTGSDIALGIGQTAFQNVSALLNVPLRNATGDNQIYEINVLPNYSASPSATGSNSVLLPNNVLTAVNAVSTQTLYGQQSSTFALQQFFSNFILDAGFTLYHCKIECHTRTLGKTVVSVFKNKSNTGSYYGTHASDWNDTTTPWASLGTLGFANPITGQVTVKRIL